MKANATIRRILYDNEISPDFDEKLDLVIPAVSCAERDQALGSYLSAWNRVEDINETLLSHALKLKGWEAGPITSLGLNANALYDLLLGFGEQSLDPQRLAILKKYLEGFKVRNTKRNRIVHGNWKFSVAIGASEEGIPYIASSEWRRVYTPSAVADRKLLYANDAKALGKFSFSIKEISNAREEVIDFILKNRQVAGVFPDPHEGPNGQS